MVELSAKFTRFDRKSLPGHEEATEFHHGGGINREMKKRSQSLRKKILVAIKLCSSALHVGKLENFSLRPSEEVFNICNGNSFLVKILHILQRKQYVHREQHRYQRRECTIFS